MPLEFSEANLTTIDHGRMWPGGPTADFGRCFWEAFIRPDPLCSGYVVADGYGGSHAVLLGINGGRISGNWCDGVIAIPYTGHSTFSDEWVTIAIWYDGTGTWLYADGVPDGYIPHAGTNKRTNLGAGNANCWVGGSDHSKFTGRIARITAFEDNVGLGSDVGPLTLPRIGYQADARGRLLSITTQGEYTPDFAVDYTNPAPFYADVAPKTLRGRKWPGFPIHAHDSASDTVGMMGYRSIGRPLPRHVYDAQLATLYSADGSAIVTGEAARTPAAPPAAPTNVGSLLIYDSFDRPRSTWVTSPITGPSLGSTDTTGSPSRGSLAWQYGKAFTSKSRIGNLWGILDGKAFCECDSDGLRLPYAWVDAARADHYVEFTRTTSSTMNPAGGMIFRGVDANNFWYLTYDGAGTTSTNATYGTLVIVNVTANAVVGTATYDFQTPGYSAHTRVGVNCRPDGSTIDLYLDGIRRHTWTSQTAHASGTRVGLALSGLPGGQTDGRARWDRLTVRIAAAS